MNNTDFVNLEENGKLIKSRFFAGLLYPDSLPEDWLVKLEMIGQPIAISPLHDSDVDTEAVKQSDTGEIIYKKPHYHFVYIANNPVTPGSVLNKVRGVLGVQAISQVKIIHTSVRNYYDYLTHESKDAVAKNKHVYDKENITLLNHFDISRYDTMDVEEKTRVLDCVCQMIRKKGLMNVNDLWDYLEFEGYEIYDLDRLKILDVLKTNANLFKMCFDASYQNSMRDRNSYVEQLKINREIEKRVAEKAKRTRTKAKAKTRKTKKTKVKIEDEN